MGVVVGSLTTHFGYFIFLVTYSRLGRRTDWYSELMYIVLKDKRSGRRFHGELVPLTGSDAGRLVHLLRGLYDVAHLILFRH